METSKVFAAETMRQDKEEKMRKKNGNWKRIMRTFLMLMIMVVFGGVPAAVSSAAEKYVPGNVAKLTVTGKTEDSISLRWTKVNNADGYIVYSIDPKTGAYTNLTHLSATSYTVKKLKLNQTYTLQVFAYNYRNGKVYKSAKGSPIVKVKTAYLQPGKVKNLRIASYGDKSMVLKWNSAKNATGYVVKCYNPKTKKTTTVKTTTNTLVQFRNLTAKREYCFYVCSYRRAGNQTVYGKDSDMVKGTAKAINMSGVHGRYYNTTLRSNTTVKIKATGKKVNLRAGTSIIAKERKNGTVNAIWNGKEIEVQGSRLNYNSLNTSGKMYTYAQAEAFVNSKGYKSDTKYLIWVNQYSLYTYIFEGSQGEWKGIRKMKCVVGKNGLTPIKSTYKLLRKGYMYGGPIIYIAWFGWRGYGFHMRTSSLAQGAVSGGCIRLGYDDLMFLDRTCPLGTRVISY